MPRKKGDGRGRIGGRQPGSPNRDKPLKTFLRQHSADYFTPSVEEKDEEGNPTGRIISQFDRDVRALETAARVDAELKLLKFHTPQMQSASVDINAADAGQTLAGRLERLSAGEDVAAPGE